MEVALVQEGHQAATGPLYASCPQRSSLVLEMHCVRYERCAMPRVPGWAVTLLVCHMLPFPPPFAQVDSMSLIRSDPFVLISGDVISNMNLGAVISAHKARRKADKNCIMTMVMKRAAINHRTRELSDDLVIAVDADNGQLLRYVRRGATRSPTVC